MCGMGNAAKPTISPSSEIWKRPKRITSEIPYPDDALGRIAQMTKVRASSALELQSVFGADFKEIKKFLSRYFQARDAREEWLVSGGKEEEMPPPPEPIPDEWLHYFWTHFGPNPGWVQNGERDSSHSHRYANGRVMRNWSVYTKLFDWHGRNARNCVKFWRKRALIWKSMNWGKK